MLSPVKMSEHYFGVNAFFVQTFCTIVEFTRSGAVFDERVTLVPCDVFVNGMCIPVIFFDEQSVGLVRARQIICARSTVNCCLRLLNG